MFALIVFALNCALLQPELPQQASQSLHKAAEYLVSISTGGGYLWTYTVDLSQRWGEGKATETQIWVQPPGTPSVGMALLKAAQATGDEYILSAAKAAGDALLWGQLECGGWHYYIDFSPSGEKRFYYRHLKGRPGLDTSKLRNSGTLDDNNSQSAISLLIALAVQTKEERFRDGAEYALRWLLRAQYPNGGWPQWFPLIGRYHDYYTFNDGAMNDAIRVMLEAWHAFGEQKYLDAAKKAGDFIILSQGKPPQAGWAQQYDMDLRPAWARKFEPPSYCPAVTARNIRTLVDLYLATGDEKYLRPIPAAIDWLRRSKLPNGKWARFYELSTNKPLYFTRKYELTYSPDDCPTHYSFQGGYGVESAIRYYEQVFKLGRREYLEMVRQKDSPPQRQKRARSLENRVRQIIKSQDERGRWVRGGKIEMRDFVRNISIIAEYLLCLRAE